MVTSSRRQRRSKAPRAFGPLVALFAMALAAGEGVQRCWSSGSEVYDPVAASVGNPRGLPVAPPCHSLYCKREILLSGVLAPGYRISLSPS